MMYAPMIRYTNTQQITIMFIHEIHFEFEFVRGTAASAEITNAKLASAQLQPRLGLEKSPCEEAC